MEKGVACSSIFKGNTDNGKGDDDRHHGTFDARSASGKRGRSYNWPYNELGGKMMKTLFATICLLISFASLSIATTDTVTPRDKNLQLTSAKPEAKYLHLNNVNTVSNSTAKDLGFTAKQYGCFYGFSNLLTPGLTNTATINIQVSVDNSTASWANAPTFETIAVSKTDNTRSYVINTSAQHRYFRANVSAIQNAGSRLVMNCTHMQ